MTVKEKLLAAISGAIENSTQSVLCNFDPFDAEETSFRRENAKLEVYRIACLKSIKQQVESAMEENAFQEGMIRYSAILKEAIGTWPLNNGEIAPDVLWLVDGITGICQVFQD
jgi:isoleucyl-tRNA synthetase